MTYGKNVDKSHAEHRCYSEIIPLSDSHKFTHAEVRGAFFVIGAFCADHLALLNHLVVVLLKFFHCRLKPWEPTRRSGKVIIRYSIKKEVPLH